MIRIFRIRKWSFIVSVCFIIALNFYYLIILGSWLYVTTDSWLSFINSLCFTNPAAAWFKLSRIIGIISYCYPVIADTWLNFKEAKQENTWTMQNHKMNTCINHSYSWACTMWYNVLLLLTCYYLILSVSVILS